jgi:hypothetical protein
MSLSRSCKVIAREAAFHLDTKLNIISYRHLAIAISHQHLLCEGFKRDYCVNKKLADEQASSGSSGIETITENPFPQNRGDNQMNLSSFFNKGAIRLNYLIEELPSYKEKMISKHQGTLAEIQKLRYKRNTACERRMVLKKIRATMRRQSLELSTWTQLLTHLKEIIDDMRLRRQKYAFGAEPGDVEREIEEEAEAQVELDGLNDYSQLSMRDQEVPRPLIMLESGH